MSHRNEITYPFLPKSNAHLRPGQFFSFRLSNGVYACGGVITQRWAYKEGARTRFLAGLMNYDGRKPATSDRLAGTRVYHQGWTHVSVFSQYGATIDGIRPLELEGIEAERWPDTWPNDELREWAEMYFGPTKRLVRRDIIGHSITDIRQKHLMDVRGLDWAWTFFILDSGRAFMLPYAKAKAFVRSHVLRSAEPLEDHPHLVRVYGARIENVYRHPDADSVYLLLSTGCFVTNVLAESHGTGGAGVFVFAPDEVDPSELTPFWSKR